MGLGRTRRVVIVLSAAAALGVTACSGSTTGPGGGSGSSRAPAAQGAINVLDVLPPGNPTNTSQRAMYDALNTVDPTALTDDKLSTYYKNEALDPAPADVVKTETPRAGVTIKRDKYGVPLRLRQDRRRHRLRCGLCGHRGPHVCHGCHSLLGCRAPVRAAWSEQGQSRHRCRSTAPGRLHDRPRRTRSSTHWASGPTGKALVDRLDAFVAGVNAARKVMCPTVTAPPARPLPAAQSDPHALYAGRRRLCRFAHRRNLRRGGGQEAQNAVFLRQLQGRARRRARPRGPQRSAGRPRPEHSRYRSGRPALRSSAAIDQAAVALPDIPSKAVKWSAVPAGSRRARDAVRRGCRGRTTLADRLHVPAQMSNALLVSSSHTTTGHPISVMGPQTAYQAPNFFDEIALHGPHYDARGVAFANLQFAVLIGHGRELRLVGHQLLGRRRRHRARQAVQPQRQQADRQLDEPT